MAWFGTPDFSAWPRGFVVLDVETTGLDPERDAIVEITMQCVESSGRTAQAWTTLVDPGRDFEPTIHGIDCAKVRGQAPPFDYLLPLIRSTLEDRVAVAHQAAFDRSFLAAAGVDYPAWLCTYELSHFHLPPGRHSLAACVENLENLLSGDDDDASAQNLVEMDMKAGNSTAPSMVWRGRDRRRRTCAPLTLRRRGIRWGGSR